MTGITVTRRGGTLLAVKRADTARAARLRHEAEVLHRVDHPGLVELVGLDEGPPVELHTRFAGPESWDRAPPDSDPDVVAGLAGVAAIVADLHDVGVAHRELDPSHVIATAEGRPVLCGLGDAGPADEDGRRADIEGLADLIDAVAPGAGEPTGRRLASLAAACRSGRLDARTLAGRLDAIPLESSETTRRSPVATVTAALGRVPRAALAAAGFVMLGVAGWALTTGDPARVQAIADNPTPTAPPPPMTTDATVAVPTTDTARPPTTTSTPTPTTAVEPLAVGDPLELVHAGRRYGIGRADDVAVVGDWDCNGTVTPAALRVATGAVAVFDRWPAPGEELEPARVVTVEGAEALESEPGAGCDTLRVRTATGSRLIEIPAPS